MTDNIFTQTSDRKNECHGEEYMRPGGANIVVQLGLSLILGVAAFIAFCILRPRWSSLYAARKRRLDSNIGLPALPDTFFGWIPELYKITEEQVLASAGLDAFVFLSFFKMAIRLLAIMAFFAYAVLWPLNRHFIGDPDWNIGDGGDKPPKNESFSLQGVPDTQQPLGLATVSFAKSGKGYLWIWLLFTYFFTALTIYIMNKETFRVIRIRQDYLGTQSTITDRTFRLTGIPSYLKSEDKIKELIENLEIGQVEGVNLCRDWKELDDLIDERAVVLRKVEEIWSVYLGKQSALPKSVGPISLQGNSSSAGEGQGAEHGNSHISRDGDEEEAGENGRLLGHGVIRTDLVEGERPTLSLRYGPLRLRYKKVDAIDYYEEKLRQVDQKIQAAREKTHTPTGTAFVTMDSIAACQMAIQARIDPRPGQLLTKPAPSPPDVMWFNTYAPRGIRRMRSWSITIFVSLLSVIWASLVASLATLLTICNLEKWFPNFVETLREFTILKALVETGLPTLLVSLLNVAVPFLYEFLSYRQGMISRGDIELSIISKNFFFSFFNLFIVFAVSGTAISTWKLMTKLQDALRDTTQFMRLIADQIDKMSVFYTNFIMLQGLGLFPFRLLEAGSVFLYPIYRMGAKTPRDFAQIMEPPLFSYGFYLPTALLIFILCLVYSVLQFGFMVLTVGLVYFILGYFTYKYQLLYAMDQSQHATGGAWRIICNRIILGLFVFQVVMTSQMALQSAFVQSVLTAPLIMLTIWYQNYFQRRFVPLTRFIALRSIQAEGEPGENAIAADEDDFEGTRPSQGLLRRGSTVDEDKEKGMRFLNPSLTMPLEQPWIYQDPPPINPSTSSLHAPLVDVSAEPEQSVNSQGSNSSLSLGDTHIWREAQSSNRRAG